MLLGIWYSYIKGRLVTLVRDMAIEKYLIGIQWLSIYIGVDLYPTTSIDTCMVRHERHLQGLELSRTETQIEW